VSTSRSTIMSVLVAGAILTGGTAALPAHAEPHQAVAAQKAAPASATLSVSSPSSPSSLSSVRRSTRQQTLRRARVWLTANKGRQVPYSQSKRWKDGYRQDCSGYVSMALGLSRPGPYTVALAGTRSITRPIKMSQLKPGDLVIDAIGNSNFRHVVIFEKWNNPRHTTYTAYEQRGHHGTDHRSLAYGLKKGSQYKASRPVQYGD
jgi:uncharacterized protein YfaT (DUF1175 family)